MIDIIILLCICYLSLFSLSIYLKDNSIADIFWGVGFIAIAWFTFLQRDFFFFYQIVVTALVTLWGVRIALYIFSKKLKKSGEDLRYKEWRDEWKYFYTRSFFQIYILQAFLLCIIALPIIFVNRENVHSGSIYYTIIWASIALFGLLFETIADLQLSSFMKTKKKWEIFTAWLYAYSRHPNYFWESVFWLGISVIAFPIEQLSILSFLMITYLLRYVSGVPMIEKRYIGNKAYDEYKKKVSVFFPGRKV